MLQMKEEEQMKVMCLLWLWWKEHNKVREGNNRRAPAIIAHIVHQVANDYMSLRKKEIRQPQPMHIWQKPVDDQIKLNCDGAFSSEDSSGGWGYVLRDRDGDVILAGAGCLPHIQDALQAEVYACIKGVRGAISKGFNNINIETDLLILEQAMESNSLRLATVGGAIHELKCLIIDNFSV